MVVLGAFAGVQVATRDQHPEATAGTGRLHAIVITSLLPGRSADGEQMTLADALVEACRNPGDDVIRFNPAVFGSGDPLVTLTEPIIVDGNWGGHDRIDGSLQNGQVTLDVSGCQDAGIVVSGRAEFSLANLTVRGGRVRGILAKEQARLDLNGVSIVECSGPGVAIFGEARARIQSGLVSRNRTHGVEVREHADASLEDTRLNQNGQSDVAAFDQAVFSAAGCHMASNGDWNVVLSQAAEASLSKCTLSQAAFTNADASGASRLRLIDCTLEDGRRMGIFATGRAVVDMTGTRLHRHASRCIELQDEAAVTMEASAMEFGGEYGMALFARSSVHATQVRIARNGSHGVCLRQQARGWFDRCIFTGNGNSGIACPDAYEGGPVRAGRCVFTDNGMRPLSRGPLHISPLVPTPIRIDGPQVTCMTEPNATVELYLDRAGEAARYFREVTADRLGRFTVDCRDVPPGHVMTAAATSGESTSEFNVVAGADNSEVLHALLGNTGPLSDNGGQVHPDALLRRWEADTRLVFDVVNPPSSAVERYVRFLVDRINDWTGPTLKSELAIGPMQRPAGKAVLLPIRYVPADSPKLVGRGGATFMKWDAGGSFLAPMEVVLALGRDARQTCPRVLAHEVGHTLGLCHARVGLLSRMQGIVAPARGSGYVNDFSPTMTYFDVLALQILHDRRNAGRLTLRHLMDKGALPVSQPKAAQGATVSRSLFSPSLTDLRGPVKGPVTQPAPDVTPANRP